MARAWQAVSNSAMNSDPPSTERARPGKGTRRARAGGPPRPPPARAPPTARSAHPPPPTQTGQDAPDHRDRKRDPLAPEEDRQLRLAPARVALAEGQHDLGLGDRPARRSGPAGGRAAVLQAGQPEAIVAGAPARDGRAGGNEGGGGGGRSVGR